MGHSFRGGREEEIACCKSQRGSEKSFAQEEGCCRKAGSQEDRKENQDRQREERGKRNEETKEDRKGKRGEETQIGKIELFLTWVLTFQRGGLRAAFFLARAPAG